MKLSPDRIFNGCGISIFNMNAFSNHGLMSAVGTSEDDSDIAYDRHFDGGSGIQLDTHFAPTTERDAFLEESNVSLITIIKLGN